MKLSNSERQLLIDTLESELDMNAEDASVYVKEGDDDTLEAIIHRIQTLRHLENEAVLEEHHVEFLLGEINEELDAIFDMRNSGGTGASDEDLEEYIGIYNKLGGEQVENHS